MTPAAFPPIASPVTDHTAEAQLRAKAAAGYFRAIALWLNQVLVARGLYAQVQAASPGCLQIRVEYDRAPGVDELSRFVCHRIWHLNSPLIEGIHLSVRPVGATQVEWERRIRIVSPSRRQQSGQSQPKAARPSGLPPRIKPSPAPVPKHLPQQTAKTLRALMISGSAVAAFILGCLMEVLISTTPGPNLPLPKQASVSPPAVEVVPVVATGTPLPARPSDRDPVVQGALEPVAVIAHEAVPQPTNPTVTLVFGGEVDLDAVPYASLVPENPLLAGVAAYQQADVAMVSLNNSLATAATTLDENFIDRQRPDAVALLKQGGVDIVDLAGEDTMAFGEQGLAETLETLDRNGVYRVGAGRDEREARRPEIIDVKGQRIAYLSYNQRDLVPASGDIGGVNVLDKADLVADIRALRPEVDWLVVNYRWSEDLPEQPADWQTNLARLAIDQGADVVVGHHPTQLQGTEVYKGRPIAYSLGDVLFTDAEAGEEGAETPAASVVLQVSLGDRQMKVDLLPVTVKQGRPQQAIGPEAEAILAKIQAASQEFPEPMAPSMVLEVRPEMSPATPEAGGTFIDGAEGTLENLDGVPAAPKATPDGGQSADEAPLLAPSDDFSSPEAAPPLPADLDQWGPKESPGQDRFVPIPEAGEALIPLPEQVPGPSTAPIPAEVSAPSGGTSQPAFRPDSIPAHSEPLVGPLARVQAPEAELEALEADPVLEARSRLGLPQTRVFKPLSSTKDFQALSPTATTLERSP